MPRICKYHRWVHNAGHEAFLYGAYNLLITAARGSRRYFSPIFLASTIIDGNFFPAVLALLRSSSSFSNRVYSPVPTDGSAKTDGGAYFSREAVPAGGRRMREATFRFLARRKAVRKKRNYFPERMPGIRTYRYIRRAKIFAGLNGGDSEVKKGGRVGKEASG